MRTKARVLVVVFVLSSTSGLAALEFDVSPNDDGSLDFRVAIDWYYGDSWYSGLVGEYRNITGVSETDDSYVTTNGKTLSLGADVIGFQGIDGSLAYEVALNVLWENSQIREIGYQDLTQDSTTTRFFILNDRVLNLVLPRINGQVAYVGEGISFVAGGEYAPWLWVALDQELTIAPGLPLTEYSSEQSANNAFSLNATFAFLNDVLTPKINAEYDHLAIAYGVRTAGGETTVDTLIQTLRVGATLVFEFVDLNGIHPTISIGYKWDWTTDQSVEGAAPLEDAGVELGFGVEL